MAQAGTYSDQFTWLVCSEATDAGTGQRAKTHTATGRLWGTLTEATGTTSTEYDAATAEVTAEIVLRNYVNVKTEDRLIELAFNDTYHVSGVSRRNNETIVQAVKYQP